MRGRSGKPDVAPVAAEGIRYEAMPWGKARGLAQNGGYVAAIDEKTGEELWLLKVYDVVYKRGMEGDKQDVFITGLALSDSGRRLTVRNQAGKNFSVDLKSRAVSSA